MANYYAHTVSNYFRVRDVEGFREDLIERDAQDLFEYKDGRFCVATHGDLYSYVDNEEECMEYDCDDFCKLIQFWIKDSEKVFISSVGNEKLRYLGASCTIIEKDDIKYYDLFDMMSKEFNNGESIF